MTANNIFLKIIKLGFLAASIDKQTVQEEVDVIKLWSLTHISDKKHENQFYMNTSYNQESMSKQQVSDYLKSIYIDLKNNRDSPEDLLDEIKKSYMFEDDFSINNIPLKYSILQFILSIIESDNKLTTEEANFIFNIRESFLIDDKYYTDKINKLILNISKIDCFTDIVDKIYGLEHYTDNKKLMSILRIQYQFWNTLTASKNRSFRERANKLTSSLAQMRIKYNV